MTKRFNFPGLAASLALCAILALGTGCNTLAPGHSRGSIQFKAAGPNVLSTKAHWGEDVGGTQSGTQRIIWDDGDIIRLASNYAQSAAGDNSFEYAVIDVSNGKNAAYSYGRLSPKSSTSGLFWDEDKARSEHKFWGVYPSKEITLSGDEARIEGNIPDDGLLMVSRLDAASDEAVSLYFYPAFTTIKAKITNGTGVPVTINSISFSSDSPLHGTFNARIGSQGVEDVQVAQPAPTPTPEPEETENVFWESAGQQPGELGTPDYFKDAKVGEKIRIYFTRTDQWYYNVKLLSRNWGALTYAELNGADHLDLSNYPVEQNVESYFEFTITEDILSKLYIAPVNEYDNATCALRMQTGGCTVSRIVYISSSGTKAASGIATKAGARQYVVANEVGDSLADEATMAAFSEFSMIPKDITDLKLSVTYTAEGKGTITKFMDLSDITFEAGKQYRLVGIVLPDALDVVDIVVVSNGQVIHLGRDTWKF